VAQLWQAGRQGISTAAAAAAVMMCAGDNHAIYLGIVVALAEQPDAVW
jgi:hypothetical protein